MKSAIVVGAAVLASLTAGALLGQEWTGPAGVGIEVRDEAGQPISGAAVVLAPGATAGDDAPPFVFTDAGGRIEVRNLAEGEWQVEVRAAGYMIFNGYLRLAPGKPPEVGFSSRQRTGTFWQPLQVRFFVPGSPGDPVMVAATKEEKREEKKRVAEKDELEKQVKEGKNREAVRAERRAKASTGEVATLKQPPSPPPAPPPPPPPVVAQAPSAPPPPVVAQAPPPAPPPPVVVPPPPAPPTRIAEAAPPPAPPPPPPAAAPPRAAQPQTAPPPSVAPPPTAQPRSAPPPDVAPPPIVAPPSAPPPPAAPPPAVSPAQQPPPPRVADAGTRPSAVTPSEPAPARPAPAPAAPEPSAPRDAPRPVPSIQARPVLFTGGACPECKPGEWALIIERRAAASPSGAAGVTTCGEGRDAAVGHLAHEVLVPAGAAIAAFAGPVADSYGNGLPAATSQSVPADLAATLGPRDGPCQDFAGVLPQGARFIGFRFEAEDSGGKGDCFGEDPCSIGQARWSNNPRIERTATVTVIHSSFANESTSAERRARMTLYFQPPRGWRPPA